MLPGERLSMLSLHNHAAHRGPSLGKPDARFSHDLHACWPCATPGTADFTRCLKHESGNAAVMPLEWTHEEHVYHACIHQQE